MPRVPYYLSLALLLLVLTQLWQQRAIDYLLWVPLFIFVLLPILDVLGGRLLTQPDEQPSRQRDLVHDLPLWLWLPVQLSLIVMGIDLAAEAERTLGERVLVIVDIGLITGALGITVAHELMHRRGRIERALAELLMVSVCYPQFVVEHVLGHHRRVATPEDPATARRGETVYAFWLRSIVGSTISAWRLEGERVARQGQRSWSPADRRMRLSLLLALAGACAWARWGGFGLVALGGQGLVAILMLESINYIEHYGLRRRELSTGRYERCQPHHSWNAPQRVTNWLLFNLQRHSDHHFLATRPYWQLRHHEQVPELPVGYPTMLLVAWLPPLFFLIMERRLARYRRPDA